MKSVFKLFALIALSGSIVACGGGGGGGGSTSQGTEQQIYNDALATYNAMDYSGAITGFRSLIDNYPSSSLVVDAQLYVAKADYWLGDYATAKTYLDTLISNNPSSSLIDNAYYWRGKVQHALNDFQLARDDYQAVINYGTSTYEDNAVYGIALTYFDEAELADPPNATLYDPAITWFNDVLNNYPLNSKSDNAQYYLGKTYHAIANITGLQTDFDLARAEYAKVNTTNYPTSTYLDNAAFQSAKTYYDQARLAADAALYTTAATQFRSVIANTDGSDDLAQYYVGKSYHAIANLSGLSGDFDNARTEYGLVNATSYPTSVFLDNAAFQAAKTYFEQAEIAAIPSADLYIGAGMAADQLRSVIANTDGSDDIAQYYLAKSYHAAANISTLAQDYTNARTEYALLNSTNYPASIYLDNAAYHYAITYYDETNYASAITELGNFVSAYSTSSFAGQAYFYTGQSYYYSAIPDYVSARSEYSFVISNYPDSIKADNAQYFTGLTYHNENDCTNELVAMQLVVTNYPTNTVLVNSAQAHIDDINSATSTHTCI